MSNEEVLRAIIEEAVRWKLASEPQNHLFPQHVASEVLHQMKREGLKLAVEKCAFPGGDDD